MRALLPILLACCANLAHGQGTPNSPDALVQAWVTAFNECSAEKLAALYDSQAALWGTNSGTLAQTPESVRAYFDRACSASPPIRVILGQTVTRTYGTVAAVTGTYDFSREGAAFPARFSFAVVSGSAGWRVIQHHSSPLPGR